MATASSSIEEKAGVEEMAEPATIDHSSSEKICKSSHVVTDGPDIVAPSDVYTTSCRHGAVRLRLEESGPLSIKPISLPTMLQNAARKHANSIALATKRTGEWVKWSYADYYMGARMTAKAFMFLGLEPHNSVCILGFNAPEWSISSCAAVFAGGCATGVYATNSPEACRYVLDDSRANLVVVENDEQLQKIIQVWDSLPNLKAIIQYTGKLMEKRPNVYEWSELSELAKNVSDDDLQTRLSAQAVNHCCCIVYTSGTTGLPKGVMLSHDNITWSAGVSAYGGRLGQEVILSYLPLSHTTAQMFDIMVPIYTASAVYFASSDALKGSLVDYLRDVRPTIFVAVPRVYEKIAEKMKEKAKQITGIKKKMATWAKDIGYRGCLRQQRGESLPFGWSLANVLVFKKVRAALGFDRCIGLVSGAAPMAKETLNFFMSLNLPIFEAYGTSECSGPHTMGYPWKYRNLSVGCDLPGTKTQIVDADDDGNGEICISGRHLFMGYVNKPEETEKTIDAQGRLHTGDIGRRDEAGFLYITGRVKDILITAGGENVSPVLIEDIVKEELPCVRNCMLIGDRMKFLSIFLTFKTNVDVNTMLPQDELSPVALDWCRSIGSDATSVTQILDRRDRRVLAAVQAGIDRANERAISRAQKIQKWSLLPSDFSIPGGELGPTMKLLRRVVLVKYKDTIEAFYDV